MFEDSPLGLDKWLPAVWLIVNAKNGISSCEIGRALKVTQKTAWFMLHRIRLAMQNGSFVKMTGTVEVDETYIGGKAANMHKDKRAVRIKGRGMTGKDVVMGLLERGGDKGKSFPRAPQGSEIRRQGQLARRDSPERGSGFQRLHGLHCPPTALWMRSTFTRPLTTPWSTSARASTRTAWKTSGRCSSARSKGTYVSVNAEHLSRYSGRAIVPVQRAQGQRSRPVPESDCWHRWPPPHLRCAYR